MDRFLGRQPNTDPVSAGRFTLTHSVWTDLGITTRAQAQAHVNKLARSDKPIKSDKKPYPVETKWQALFWLVLRKPAHDRLPAKLRPPDTKDIFLACSAKFTTPERSLDKATVSRWWKKYEQPVKAWLEAQQPKPTTESPVPHCPDELLLLLEPLAAGKRPLIPTSVQLVVLEEYRTHRKNGIAINGKNLQLMLQDALRRDPNPLHHGINVTIRMVDSFKKRNGLAWRKITTKAQKLPSDFETKTKPDFIALVRGLLGEHLILLSLLLNLDETGILIFPASTYSYDEKGSRCVSGVQVDSKAAITKITTITADGQILPYVLVMQGKLASNLPPAEAPPGSIFTCTPTHFTNVRVTLLTVQEIIIPYVYKVRMRDGLASEQKALLLWDNYSGHDDLEIIKALDQANILLVPLPPNTTSELQPLDKLVNAEEKKLLRKTMNTLIADQMTESRRLAPTPEARASIRLDDVLPSTAPAKRLFAASLINSVHQVLSKKHLLIAKSWQICGYVPRPNQDDPAPTDAEPGEKKWWIRFDDHLSTLLTLPAPTSEAEFERSREDQVVADDLSPIDELFRGKLTIRVPFAELPASSVPVPVEDVPSVPEPMDEDEQEEYDVIESDEDSGSISGLESDDEKDVYSSKKRKHPSMVLSDEEEDGVDRFNAQFAKKPRVRGQPSSTGGILSFEKFGPDSYIKVHFPVSTITDAEAKAVLQFLKLDSNLKIHELPDDAPPSNLRMYTFTKSNLFTDRTGLINVLRDPKKPPKMPDLEKLLVHTSS